MPLDCAKSFCGCWRPATLSFESTILDNDKMPIKGIKVFCSHLEEPIATADENGKVYFSIDTRYSPGCHYERCSNLKLVDPKGIFETLNINVGIANKQFIIMAPAELLPKVP